MNALERLPQGTDAYDAAYNDAMLRIQSQNPGQAELAKQVLAWITRSTRELHEDDLQTALAIKPGDQDLDVYDIPDIADILDSCAGLVTVVEETRIVRLVHYTMQEYFDRTWTRWFPDAENELGVACVTYLLFRKLRGSAWSSDSQEHRWNDSAHIDPLDSSSDTERCGADSDAGSVDSESQDSFSERTCSSNDETTVSRYRRNGKFDRMLDANPFYRHAAVHWAHHARGIEEPWPELKQFLSCPEAFRGVFKFLYESGAGGVDCPRPSSLMSYRTLDRVTETHLLAYVGLVNVLRQTHDEACDLDPRENGDPTPLMHAADRGHLPMVTYLLDRGADHTLQNYEECTALGLACRMGHLDVVEALLQMDNNDVNLYDLYGGTPFLSAVELGNLDIVERLLATGKVDIEYGGLGLPPLGRAVSIGRVDICRVLLDKGGANINSRLTSSLAPLSQAVVTRSLPALKFLLERDGIQVDLKDRRGRTALHLAAERGHEEMTGLLVDLGGADVTERDEYDHTPLMASISLDANPAVVEVLLSAEGTEPDARNLMGRTAFSLAATSRSRWASNEVHLRLMDRLKATQRVDINSQDNEGRTPLHHAVLKENVLAVKKLLQYDGINPNIPDRQGLTPLKTLTRAVIAAAGVPSIRELESRSKLLPGMCRPLLQELTELAADLAMWFETSTPPPFGINPMRISWASSECSARSKTGIYDSSDEAGHVHIQIACFGNRCKDLVDMAQCFLETTGTDVDRRNTGLDGQPCPASGQTKCPALVVACELGADADLVGRLSYKAAINAVDNRGISPLSSAVAHSPVDVVGHLLARGAHPESRDRLGRTALGHVTGETDPAIIKLLLQHGADVHTKDLQGKTPLMKVVSGEDSEEAVAILLEAGACVDDKDEEGHDVIWHAREGLPLDERRHLIEMLETSLGRPAGEEGWEEGTSSA
jgi:ankyrin repeat protein